MDNNRKEATTQQNGKQSEIKGKANYQNRTKTTKTNYKI